MEKATACTHPFPSLHSIPEIDQRCWSIFFVRCPCVAFYKTRNGQPKETQEKTGHVGP
jgi:hypothetical protein